MTSGNRGNVWIPNVFSLFGPFGNASAARFPLVPGVIPEDSQLFLNPRPPKTSCKLDFVIYFMAPGKCNVRAPLVNPVASGAGVAGAGVMLLIAGVPPQPT